MNALLARLPHQQPAALIDDVLACAEHSVSCRVACAPHPSLAPHGRLPATLGLEVLAQAAAVWMLTQDTGRQAEGMLVQCRQFRLHRRYLEVGLGLTAHCQSTSPESGLGLSQFQGHITDPAGNVLCEATFLILNLSNAA